MKALLPLLFKLRIKLPGTVILSFLLFSSGVQQLQAQEIDYKGSPEWTWHKQGQTEYYLYTPKGMRAGKKYPVALFLHGCCGKDDHATLRNCVDAPVRMWHNFGENIQRTPTYIIAPATSRGWAQHIPDLKKVMDNLIDNQNADARRMYICGFSMGAQGTFTFINQYPDYFAAAMTMGMKFSGDSLKVKNLPMWISQGETDFYGRPLKKQVQAIRVLNGYKTDTGSTFVKGVNPLYTSFKGLGHVIQWEATTRQDMLGWAYSNINDGNKYPDLFFNFPEYESTVEAGKPVNISVTANDPDGVIKGVDVYLNHVLLKTLTKAPFTIEITPVKGRNLIDAVATDNGGKSKSASLVIKTLLPLKIVTETLTAARAGKYFKTRLEAEGYGAITFSPSDLPEGIELNSAGILEGIPVKKGSQTVKFTVKDSTQTITGSLNLLVNPKAAGDVLVTKAMNADGTRYQVSKLMKGETPNFNSKDSAPPLWKEEINFSSLGKYDGMTYIKTDVNDTSKTAPAFTKFHTDENVTVFVAYEVLDLKYHSSQPDWLKTFSLQTGQIVAQYRYFNVYAKKYPKGEIVLPGADARRNKIATNYFVIVKKAD